MYYGQAAGNHDRYLPPPSSFLLPPGAALSGLGVGRRKEISKSLNLVFHGGKQSISLLH